MRPLFSEEIVSLADIRETNDAFRITTEADKDTGSLVRSLTTVGLITPLILKKGASGEYIIVTGFRRLDALKSLNINETRCHLLPPETDDLTCLQLSIADNACQRKLNPGEQVRAMDRLATYFDDADRLRETAASLSLPSSRAEIDKLKAAAGLPPGIFDYLSRGQIPLSIAVALARVAEAPAIILADIFEALKMGVNKQREVLTLTEEIAVREGKTLLQVLTEEGLRQIIDDEQVDRGRRDGNLRVYLRQRRFPAIMQKQEWFARQIKSLKLGNRMTLTPPDNFEGPDYVLRLTFKNMEELEAHYRRLADIIDNPEVIKEILG